MDQTQTILLAVIIAVVLLLALTLRKCLRSGEKKAFVHPAPASDPGTYAAALLKAITTAADTGPKDSPSQFRTHFTRPLHALQEHYWEIVDMRGGEVTCATFVLYDSMAEMEPSIHAAAAAVEQYLATPHLPPNEKSWATRAHTALQQMPTLIRLLGVSMNLE